MKNSKLWMAGVSLGLLAAATAPANAAPGCWGPKASYKGPSAPKAPGPVGPGRSSGGGSAGAPAAGGKTASTGAAAAITAPTERSQSSKEILKLDWNYPTYKVEQATTGSNARAVRRALSSEVAFRTLAGDDPRPLLVLRECEVCNGTDEALLSKGADNERTFLLSTWFHCVKLPVDVLEKDHPFFETFGHDDPEHLFVSLPDGSMKMKLESQTSRVELWDAMGKVLAASYKDDAQAAVKAVQKSLDRLDILDGKLLDLRAKRNELLETEAAGSKKLFKVDVEIAEIDQQLTATKAAIAKASKLELKRASTPEVGAGAAKSEQ